MKAVKLNLFALPSQTAILFWLIAGTMIGSILFGTAGTAPFPIRWLTPVVVLLSLWGFLSLPDRELRKGKLVLITTEYPLLTNAIRNLSAQIGLKRVPTILLSNENRKMQIMGSFRRWHVVLGKEDVQTLEDLLSQPQNSDLAEMKILHELYHFKNGDYWQLGLLTEMFKTTFSVMFWFMCFFGGWMFVLSLAAQSFLNFSPSSLIEKISPDIRPLIEQALLNGLPSDTELDALQSKVAEINFIDAASFVLNISLPFIFITAFLWYFYLPLFWQMREFYADAGMVQTLGTSAPIWKVLPSVARQGNSVNHTNKHIFWTLWEFIVNPFSQFRKISNEKRRFTPNGRTDALLDPRRVFYDWKKIALYLGGLTLVLEIFLSTPLTLPIIGQNPVSYATLVILGATGYFLLPQLILGEFRWFDALLIIIVINLIRLAWLVITLGVLWTLYFLDPNALFEVLRSAIYSTARYTGNATFELNILDFLAKASFVNLLQVPIIFTIQVLSLNSLLYLFKRLATWYSFLQNERIFKRTILVLTVGLILVLLFSILPLISSLLKADFYSLARPGIILQFMVGILILAGGICWFVIQDRRFSNKCPTCNAYSAYSSKKIENCQSCGNRILPWLWTEYQDD